MNRVLLPVMGKVWTSGSRSAADTARNSVSAFAPFRQADFAQYGTKATDYCKAVTACAKIPLFL